MLNILLEAQELIHQEIDLTSADPQDNYDALLGVIERRVIQLLDTDEQLLFSYLYRLDVLEVDLVRVMKNKNLDKVSAISSLILERQILRVKTKKMFPQSPIEGWEW